MQASPSATSAGRAAAKASASTIGRAQVGGHVHVPQRALERAEAVVVEQGGVVDQQGQGTERLLGRPPRQGCDCGFVGQVGRQRRSPAAARAQVGQRGLRLVRRVAVVDGHVVAGVGERQADGAPDPLCAAGDERRRALAQSGRPNSNMFTAITATTKIRIGRMAPMDVSFAGDEPGL